MTDSMRETTGSSAAPRAPHPWVTAGRARIRFGVGQISPLDDWPAHLEVVRLAEELGFDSYWFAARPEEGVQARSLRAGGQCLPFTALRDI